MKNLTEIFIEKGIKPVHIFTNAKQCKNSLKLLKNKMGIYIIVLFVNIYILVNYLKVFIILKEYPKCKTFRNGYILIIYDIV